MAASTSNGDRVMSANLSGPRRQLLETMRRLEFGRIEGLVLRDGEPAIHPLPRIVREIKLGGDGASLPGSSRDDFELQRDVIELFTHFDRLVDGIVESIEVRHGRPFRLIVAQSSEY